MGEQTGSAVIGELLEGEVDLRLQLGEGGRVASELLRPALLLLGERCLEVLKGLLQRKNLRTGFASQAKLHGRPLACLRLLDTSAILAGKGFRGFTFRDCTHWKALRVQRVS
jgi:hypothetical protein